MHVLTTNRREVVCAIGNIESARLKGKIVTISHGVSLQGAIPRIVFPLACLYASLIFIDVVNAAPPPETAQAVERGAVAGSAWVTRGNGLSDTQRGMRISLLKPTVDKRTMTAALQATAKTLDALAVHLQKEADEIRKKFVGLHPGVYNPWQAGGTSPVNPHVAKADEAAAVAAKAASVRSRIRTLPARMTTVEFHKLLADYAPTGVPDFAATVAALHVADATTDGEGKFKIEDVVNGDYFLYAQAGKNGFFLDWVVPVKVIGGEVAKQDMSSDNAAIVRDGRRR